ncbi:MAG: winged helix DNA-binding domain-containing protein [Chloroflexi bacterium]|nr:winged helix DNA-binding domain-containing protein [Chloroflexota bacterium]MDA1241182.1 winged helix DNA-binding domain-containing protein [Chloroflexota bacterium]
MGESPVLSTRALNRALLARQGLLRREARPALEVIEHLVGMQSQVPTDPYAAFWSRLDPFDPEELSRLMEERAVARAPLMRTTIHLASARDTLGLRPLLQPVLTRTQRGAFGKRLPGVDVDGLAEAGRALLEQETLTFAQVRDRLGEAYAGHEAMAVTNTISYLVPLVQVPPRGLWRKSGLPTWTTTEPWLGKPRAPRVTLDEMVWRYLGVFGPASVQDVQAWSGLTRLREVMERLRPRLLTFRDEHGRELFDQPDVPRPPEETPAPVRFLPQYDNVVLGHADRARIVSEDYRARTWRGNGNYSAFTMDGFVAGLWHIDRAGEAVTMTLDPFERWTKRDRAAVEREAERFIAFLHATATSRKIVVIPLA